MDFLEFIRLEIELLSSHLVYVGPAYPHLGDRANGLAFDDRTLTGRVNSTLSPSSRIPAFMSSFFKRRIASETVVLGTLSTRTISH